MAPVVRTTPAARRRPWRRFVFLALLIVPIIEIAAIIGVGRVIGGWPTVLLLIVESLLGAWLVRREGGRTWRALQTALTTGAMPSRELADAALVLIGGTLLLTPGFVTDLVGFFFILPLTRPLTRAWLERLVRARLLTGSVATFGPGDFGSGGYRSGGFGPSGFGPGPFDATGPGRRSGTAATKDTPPAAGQTVPGTIVDR